MARNLTTDDIRRIYQLPEATSLALGSRLIIYDPNDKLDKQIDPKVLINLVTANVEVSDPSTESYTGVGETQQEINETNVQGFRTLYELISQLQVAEAYIEMYPIDQIATDVEETLTIRKTSEPTDPSIIDVDEVNNLILIKEPNTYEFVTTAVFINDSNQDRDITVRTRDIQHGDAIITERTITVDRNTTRTLTVITPAFVVAPGDEPVDLRATTQTNGGDITVRFLESTIKTKGGAAVSGALSSIAYPSNASIRAITNYAAGVDVFNYTNGFLYEFDLTSTATDDDDITLKPDDIAIGDPGRWIRVQKFLIDGSLDNLPFNLWQFNDSVSDIDPGFGKFIVGADFINISITQFGPSGLNVKNVLENLKSGATIVVKNRDTGVSAMSIDITGDPIDETTYFKFPATVFDQDIAFALDDICGFDFTQSGEGGGGTESVEVPFNEVISINNQIQHSLPIVQNSVLNRSKSGDVNINWVHSEIITTNGNAINHPTSDFIVFNNDYSSLTAGTYLFLFAYLPNGKIGVTINDTSADTAPPLIQTAVVEDAAKTDLVVTFNEIINITDTTGLSLNFTSGTPKTLTGTGSGSGTNTVTFTLSADIDPADVFTLEVAANNNIEDLNGNSLAATSQAVANNVGATIMALNVTMGAGETLTLPASGANDLQINWGDGSPVEDITSVNPMHLYSAANSYDITISGTMTAFAFNNLGDKDKVNTVALSGVLGSLTSAEAMFYGCSNLTLIDGTNWNTTGITNFRNFARSCGNLVTINSTNWNMSSVTTLINFAQSDSALTTLDVSLWSVPNVEDFGSFISGCINLATLNTTNWTTTSATSFASFATNASSLLVLDTSNWTTNLVTLFANFVNGCSSLTALDVSTWNTGEVLNFDGFIGNTNLTTIDVSNWNVAKVVAFSNFAISGSLTTLDTSGWITTAATTFANMFNSCNLGTIDVSTWDFNGVTTVFRMFRNNTGLADIVGLESKDVSTITVFNDFAPGVTLPTSRLNAIYNQNTGWPSQTLQDGGGTDMDLGLSTYSNSDTDAVAGRGILVNTYNWNVQDGGGV